jgi:hypothetical protein
MAGKIERFCSVTGSLSLTDSATTSGKIPFGPASGGVVIVDTLAGGANTINWHVAFGPELTPRPLYDGATAITTAVAAGRAYAIPDAAFAAGLVIPVLNAGTASIRASLKG